MATRSSRLALGTLHAQRSPVGATVRGGGGLTESDTTELKHRCVFFNSGGFGEGEAVMV